MQMAVAGGTGLVGKYVIAELRAAGHRFVIRRTFDDHLASLVRPASTDR